MGLPSEAKARLAGLVRRETVHLPDLDLDVQVRGLMLGEKERAAELDGRKQSLTLIALVVDDASGRQIWNPNSLDDLEEIAQLTLADSAVIEAAMQRVSAGKASSPATVSSPSPSPASSDEPPERSET